MHPLQEKSIVIVIFAGLMYFHNLSEQQPYFNVGILKDAPGHSFKIYKLPSLEPVSPGNPKEMVLEVIDKASASKGGATLFKSGNASDFDRRESRHDYRYMADFNALHSEGYNITEGALSPIISVKAGELSTLCITRFLTSHKGPQGAEVDYGYMADMMALKVELQKDDKLVIRVPGVTDPLVSVGYQSSTTKPQYVVIANVAPKKMQAHSRKDAQSHRFRKPTHFLYYYKAIPKGEEQQFDFELKDPNLLTYACEELPKEIRDLFGLTDRTPPPYFCGIASGKGGFQTVKQ